MKVVVSIPLALVVLTLVMTTVVLRGLNILNNTSYSVLLGIVIAAGCSLNLVMRPDAPSRRAARAEDPELGTPVPREVHSVQNQVLLSECLPGL